MKQCYLKGLRYPYKFLTLPNYFHCKDDSTDFLEGRRKNLITPFLSLRANNHNVYAIHRNDVVRKPSKPVLPAKKAKNLIFWFWVNSSTKTHDIS